MQFVRNAARGGWEGFCEETAIGRRFCQDAAKRQRPQGTVREGRGGLRAFVGSRGSGRPRKHGVADSCESAEPRTAARERRNAGGCRSLRLRTGTGMGGPQTAARAQGCGRPRKRGPRAAAKARSRRRPRGAEVTGSNGVSYNVSGRSGEAGLGVATAGRICRGSG